MNINDAIHQIYKHRENFIIIGLTGRTGSGCSTVASLLSKKKSELNIPKPTSKKTPEEIKDHIIYNFSMHNWPIFQKIEIKNVITSYILEQNYDTFIDYISKSYNKNSTEVYSALDIIKNEFEDINKNRTTLLQKRREFEKDEDSDICLNEMQKESYDYHFTVIPNFAIKLKNALNSICEDNYTSTYQLIGDNIRKSGSAIDHVFNPDKIFRLATRTNKLIKLLRKINKSNNIEQTCIIIDAIRNPFEALYFRERYAAFYLMSINVDDHNRIHRLQKTYNLNLEQIKKIDDKEYPEEMSDEMFFVSQNIQRCIELSDIHINNHHVESEERPSLQSTLIRYVSLILHPGLITPTHKERCMQIAYNAKFNSGCLSRQVGAVVTDTDYSVKSIGWNCVPKGQISCLLRNAKDLINNENMETYSDFENNDTQFRKILKDKFSNSIRDDDNTHFLNGRNLSYCFKNIYNINKKDKNQVHTRALHAEENAFLQIVKCGGQGVKNGYLFTTASPCELCSKKAYQLGISKIIYIDPYPGISTKHILACGSNRPVLELFTGAIGRAYVQLYDSIFPYKDEISILTRAY